MADVGWWDRHAELWDELVPRSGRAPTLQGELIRATGRLSDEAFRNGNANWGPMHDGFLDLCVAVLTGDETLTAEQRESVVRADELIRASIAAPDLSGHGSPLYLLSEMAVLWVDANPEPRPPPD
jgi:hypothetical protein